MTYIDEPSTDDRAVTAAATEAADVIKVATEVADFATGQLLPQLNQAAEHNSMLDYADAEQPGNVTPQGISGLYGTNQQATAELAADTMVQNSIPPCTPADHAIVAQLSEDPELLASNSGILTLDTAELAAAADQGTAEHTADELAANNSSMRTSGTAPQVGSLQQQDASANTASEFHTANDAELLHSEANTQFIADRASGLTHSGLSDFSQKSIEPEGQQTAAQHSFSRSASQLHQQQSSLKETPLDSSSAYSSMDTIGADQQMTSQQSLGTGSADMTLQGVYDTSLRRASTGSGPVYRHTSSLTRPVLLQGANKAAETAIHQTPEPLQPADSQDSTAVSRLAEHQDGRQHAAAASEIMQAALDPSASTIQNPEAAPRVYSAPAVPQPDFCSIDAQPTATQPEAATAMDSSSTPNSLLQAPLDSQPSLVQNITSMQGLSDPSGAAATSALPVLLPSHLPPPPQDSRSSDLRPRRSAAFRQSMSDDGQGRAVATSLAAWPGGVELKDKSHIKVGTWRCMCLQIKGYSILPCCHVMHCCHQPLSDKQFSGEDPCEKVDTWL